jgi:hypothetical protein
MQIARVMSEFNCIRVLRNISQSMECSHLWTFFAYAYNLRRGSLTCFIRTHLKNRILVQDRGGAEFQTGGILLYVEDLKRGTNKDIGPKDIFEMGSNILCARLTYALKASSRPKGAANRRHPNGWPPKAPRPVLACCAARS